MSVFFCSGETQASKESCCVSLCVATFPGAKSANRRPAKREEETREEVLEEKRERIPETRMNSHPVTSGPRMYPSSGGSLFKKGLDAMSYAEYKNKFLNASHVEAINRTYGLPEAAQTFETAVPFLQTFFEKQLPGPGMEHLRKVLASKQDV